MSEVCPGGKGTQMVEHAYGIGWFPVAEEPLRICPDKGVYYSTRDPGHGDQCRNEDGWVCPTGCAIVQAPPYCMSLAPYVAKWGAKLTLCAWITC